jgi:methionyl-tRNA formyltransferase
MKLHATPVEEAALQLNLKLFRSASVNEDKDLLSLLHQSAPDVILVIDFGQKIGVPWLDAPRRGCLNIHPSLLPLYRGAAPVQRAIMDGTEKTGVTLFRLVEKMDAGPILYQAESAIGEDETSAELLDRMAVLGSRLFTDHMDAILDGRAPMRVQDESRATVARKIDKSEARLSAELTAETMHHVVCALNPAPGAYVVFRGKRLKILASHPGRLSVPKGVLKSVGGALYLGTRQGSLELKTLQPEGKKAMAASDWLKGLKLAEGECVDRDQ